MMKIENDCVGPCPQGCIGTACRYRNATHYYCDACGEETDVLYSDGYNGSFCESCTMEAMNEIIQQMSFSEMAELLEFEEVADEIGSR